MDRKLNTIHSTVRIMEKMLRCMIRGLEYSGLPRTLDIGHDLIRVEALQLRYAKSQARPKRRRKEMTTDMLLSKV